MEESVGKIEHIAADALWDAMTSDVEETNSRAGFVNLTSHSLSIRERGRE